MAKQVGLFGNWTGKLANTVGYRIPLSANKITQGVRAYQPIVANPRSESQATQRMKMTAAVNFYRQLQVILNNAWQGQKYGSKSRQYFMSMAMSQLTGIPFVDKGDKRFYPGEYRVSQGSIPEQPIQDIQSGGLITTSLIIAGASSLAKTWGELSQEIINSNFGIKDGDKITFISVIRKNGQYLPAYTFVILNTESTEQAAAVFTASNIYPSQNEVNGSYYLAFNIVGATAANNDTVAAAMIVSRYPQSGTTWERSNATMFCTTAYKTEMMGAARYAAAAATYLNSASTLSSDWYLNSGLSGSDNVNPAGGSSDSNIQVTSVNNVEFTLTNTEGTQGQASIAIVTYSDGSKKAAKNQNDYLCYNNGGSYAAVSVYNQNATNQYYRYKATTANLTAIQTADSDVSGWVTVQAADPSSNDPVEERP